jgi:signal transduction histidine kinase
VARAAVINIFAQSIPRRILAALFSIYVVTYLTTAVVVYSGVRASILESDATALNRLADLKYEQLVDAIAAEARDLTAWSELDVMNDLVSDDIDKRITLTLEALKRLYGLAGDIYAFDAAGKLLASTRSAQPPAHVVRIPPQWQNNEKGLAFVDKGRDPMWGGDVVALSIPVFANFDHAYRVGTLVLTYPWSSIERLLLSAGNGMVLLEKSGEVRILAANPEDLAERVKLDGAQLFEGGASGAFVIGRSAPRDGLIKDWRLVMLHRSAIATRPLNWVAVKLVLLGAFLGIPIVFFGRWLSHRLTAPIADLTRVVSEIADTDKLDARVPVTSSDELGSLARSFNRMTDNLEKTTFEREQFVRELAALNQALEAKIAARTAELEIAIQAQRRLIGDISHEIKSPLARLSIALGLASRSAEADRPRQFDRIEKEIENISALASELLTLARLDETAAPLKFAPLALDRLIQQIIEDAAYESPARARDVIFHGEPMTLLGNADLLRRAIENVVRNAIFYTTEKTPIEITLSRTAPEIASIEVADRGPGVPAAALERLFEPFYRVDAARARVTGGAGVGLAICQRVVELHGGIVRARNNDPRGLIVAIDLPMGTTRPDTTTGAPSEITSQAGIHI